MTAVRCRVLFAITAHGFGHMTRTLEIVRELRSLLPGADPIISTALPRPRLERHLEGSFHYRPRAYEPGTAQKDCFEVDAAATREAYLAFLVRRDEELRREREFLREEGCAAVVSDIPALPVRAAAEVGIPAIGVSNFTWDWILEPLLEQSPAARAPALLAGDYACGTLHLRLPFGPETSPFPRSEAAPLVARRAEQDPESVRARLGIPRDERRLALVCPGGWGAADWSEIRVRGARDFRFLFVGDLPIVADSPSVRLPQDLPRELSFPDLVAAADLVLSKPGYGIASECVAHRTPLVGIERRGFRESSELSRGLRRGGPYAEMTLEEFFSGAWESALARARDDATPWSDVPRDGARWVAERLAEVIAGSPSRRKHEVR